MCIVNLDQWMDSGPYYRECWTTVECIVYLNNRRFQLSCFQVFRLNEPEAQTLRIDYTIRDRYNRGSNSDAGDLLFLFRVWKTIYSPTQNAWYLWKLHILKCVNDPSAGSPTETLLRLLLPLDSQVRPSSQRSARAVGRPRRGRSEGLTKPSNR